VACITQARRTKLLSGLQPVPGHLSPISSATQNHPISPASSRSACLQIDLVRGGDSHQRVESLSVCAAYGQPAIRASTSRRSRCNPFLGASALSRASLRDDELEFPVFSSLTTFVLNRNTRREPQAAGRHYSSYRSRYREVSRIQSAKLMICNRSSRR